MDGLKRYRISPTPAHKVELARSGVAVAQNIVVAFNRASAWGKFSTQYFGALKPNRKDYTVTEVKQ